MNYCPDCGGDVECIDSEKDVATTHNYYTCRRCERKWVETCTNNIESEVLHISPVKEE